MKLRPRRKAGISIPIVSFGDIAFLLIIFFMVCSNFMKDSQTNLKLPMSADVEAVKGSMITVKIDADSRIFVQDQLLSDPRSVETEVAALLEGRHGDEQRTILFHCDSGVDKSVFEPVIDSIVKAGGILAALGEKTKK